MGDSGHKTKIKKPTKLKTKNKKHRPVFFMLDFSLRKVGRNKHKINKKNKQQVNDYIILTYN